MAENQENKSNIQASPAPQANPQPQPVVNNTTNNIPNQYKPLSPWHI